QLFPQDAGDGSAVRSGLTGSGRVLPATRRERESDGAISKGARRGGRHAARAGRCCASLRVVGAKIGGAKNTRPTHTIFELPFRFSLGPFICLRGLGPKD